MATRVSQRRLFRLDLRSEQSLLGPQVDKRLHRLNLLVTNESEKSSDINKVNEACVQLLVRAHVPEWLQPVPVVDMSIATHHLPIDTLDIRFEGLWEAGGFPQPLTAGKLGERCIER